MTETAKQLRRKRKAFKLAPVEVKAPEAKPSTSRHILDKQEIERQKKQREEQVLNG